MSRLTLAVRCGSFCRMTRTARERNVPRMAPPREAPQWSFADRLRKIRRDVVGAGSQAEMAELLGVPRAAYSNWETGTSRPREIVAIARRVELLTGVPATWVLGLDEAVPAAESITTGDLETGSAASGFNRH